MDCQLKTFLLYLLVSKNLLRGLLLDEDKGVYCSVRYNLPE